MSVRPYCRSIVGYFFVFLFFEKKNYPPPHIGPSEIASQFAVNNVLGTTSPALLRGIVRVPMVIQVVLLQDQSIALEQMTKITACRRDLRRHARYAAFTLCRIPALLNATLESHQSSFLIRYSKKPTPRINEATFSYLGKWFSWISRRDMGRLRTLVACSVPHICNILRTVLS